jgi:hypothetical protein
MADWNTWPPAFAPSLRRIPDEVISVVTSVPVGSHDWGHADTSPWCRYLRLEISAVPFSVHVLDCASVKLVVPGVWAVKSGDAAAVPPMPDSSWKAWIFP